MILLYLMCKSMILYQDMNNMELIEESRKMNTSVKHQQNGLDRRNIAKMNWFDWFYVHTPLAALLYNPPTNLRR